MSTPMRHGPSQQGRTPSQMAGAAPTPPVSTPFSTSQQVQAAFSPATQGGSRTSPQQFKKSPAASQMLKQLSEGAINFDSPSATAALSALNMTGNLDLGLDNLSLPTVAGLGGRLQEDDRKKRMDGVVAMLKAAGKGRVSNEGLERVARSLDFECLCEDNPSGGPLSKTLVIAGTGLTLEIIITNHVVQHVSLTLPECTPVVLQHVGQAADILLRNLKLGPNQSSLTMTLENFRPNLERLAELDRLSILPTFNCYDAVAGVYESLLKIHKWDVQKLREEPSAADLSEDQQRLIALCTRHGCPRMHARDRIGLSLDYWRERRRNPSTAVDQDKVKTWSMLIECAAKPNDMVFFPIRISNQWVSNRIEKTENVTNDDVITNTTGSILDWQEPENTLVPVDDNSTKPDAPPLSAGGTKLPDIMFMAVFDPPVVVSAHVAAQIYHMVGATQPESSSTFDALVFPIPPGTVYDPSEPRVIKHTQDVSTPALMKGEETKSSQGGQHRRVDHVNHLFIYKPVYGQALTRIPFSHPRQLVQMLPLLRQYAFLSKLLSRSFKTKMGLSGAIPGPGSSGNSNTDSTTTPANSMKAIKDEFSRFVSSASSSGPSEGSNSLQEPSKTETDRGIAVDITLTAHPVPQLQIVFPFRSRTATIMLKVDLGGQVVILSENVFSEDLDGESGDVRDESGDIKMEAGINAGEARKTGKYSVEQWASMLELVEDVGMWVEYIRWKLE